MDPSRIALVIIDHEPQMYFGVESHTRSRIINNVTALAKAAKVFNVPCILTTVEAQQFSGMLIQNVQKVYPDYTPIDRTSINCWEDDNLRKAVEFTKRKEIVLAGLWTEACVLFPALSMKQDGYKVDVVADACGGWSAEAHEMAIKRMIQAGVIPMTWQQCMLEWQRDWGNKDTYDAVMGVIQEHSGAYGIGVEYANSMITNKQPEGMLTY
jgi:nicotinamidase-related amidase